MNYSENVFSAFKKSASADHRREPVLLVCERVMRHHPDLVFMVCVLIPFVSVAYLFEKSARLIKQHGNKRVRCGCMCIKMSLDIIMLYAQIKKKSN